MANIRPGVMFQSLCHKDPFLHIFVFFYINDLFDGLQYNPKLFVYDTPLFATVHSINKATNDLNNNSTKITKWTFQRKINFNLDICKQAHDVIFPAKGLQHCILF